MNTTPSYTQVILRSFLKKCPSCGKGPVLKSYLTQADACPHCKAFYGDIRADDGPAWMTIIIAGHILGSLILAFEMEGDFLWSHVPLWFGVGLVVILGLLPLTKCFFINIKWLIRHKEQNPSLPNERDNNEIF